MSENGEEMCFWKAIRWVFEGCGACSAALRHPWAAGNSITYPAVAISAQLGSFRNGCEMYCENKGRETPLNGKDKAHPADSPVQLVGHFINDHQRVCHIYSQELATKTSLTRDCWKWLVGKDEYPGSSTDFRSLGHMHALLLSNFKAPFSPTPFPARKGLFPQAEQTFL